MNWHNIAKAIWLETLFVECCYHDWRLWRQDEGKPFNLAEYFDARASFFAKENKP